MTTDHNEIEYKAKLFKLLKTNTGKWSKEEELWLDKYVEHLYWKEFVLEAKLEKEDYPYKNQDIKGLFR